MANKPLYQEIYKDLKEEIVSGKLPSGSRLPTEAELSASYHVSRITAKRALDELSAEGYLVRRQGSGSYVKENSAASGAKSGLIGFIVPSDDNFPFITLMSAISDELEKNNRRLVYYRYDNSGEHDVYTAYRMAMNDHCDGLIYYPSMGEADRDLLLDVVKNNVPLVVLDKLIRSLPVSCVASDNIGGGANAARALLEKGHKHIAYLNLYPEYHDVMGERYLGVCSSAMDYGIRPSEIETFYVFDSLKERSENIGCVPSALRMEKLLRKIMAKGITGVCCLNDHVALDLMTAAKHAGYSVPEDIAIVGFDGSPYAERSTPVLTTVKQNYEMIGRCSADSLLRCIDGRLPAGYKLTVPTTVIHGDSV